MDSSRVIDGLQGILDRLAAVGIVLMFLFLLGTLLSRQFTLQLDWLIPLSTLLMIWVVHLMLGRAALSEEHIQVRYFYDRLPDRLRALTNVLSLSITLLTVGVVFVASVFAMQDVWNATTSTGSIPLPVLYLAVTVGMGMGVLVYGLRLWGAVASVRESVTGTAEGER